MKSVIRILLIFFVLFSCSEGDQSNPNQDTMEPAVTGVGIPDGTAEMMVNLVSRTQPQIINHSDKS